MKNIKLFVAFLSLSIYSCSTNWEQKGLEKEASKFDSKELNVSTDSLNQFGKEGWELVNVYATTETTHPNFGNSEYVTGIQPNVRSSELNFVFKRKK